MAKAKLVLSVAMHPDRITDHTIAELLHLDISANVTPHVSTIAGNAEKGTRTRAECGVTIDCLDIVDLQKVLILWKRLRDVLNINCVWLEVWKDSDNSIAPYMGCICEWQFYLDHYTTVAPNVLTGTE